MKYYQISSGNGPVECELAVGKFLEWLNTEFSIEVLDTHEARNPGCFRSVWFESEEDLSRFVGTVRWTVTSPFRPNHKRKNWFINFTQFDEKKLEKFDESQVQFQTMRSSGHGGQNVNKVESAVRAIYLPDGFSTVCQDERSQHMNRRRALERVRIHFMESASRMKAEGKKEKWSQHYKLERGQAVASFYGENFKPEF